MFLFKINLLVGLLYVSKSKNVNMPNLPLGEYRIVVHTLYPCETTPDLKLQMNVYLSKKARNITEIKGNLTFQTPFDDSVSLDYNLASWRLTGGWIPNSYIFAVNNGCSNLKDILGNFWTSLQKAFHFPNVNCPLPKGTFISSGLNVKAIENNKAPKVYFYGKYKVIAKLKNKENELLGCLNSEFDLVRPWEVPNN